MENGLATPGSIRRYRFTLPTLLAVLLCLTANLSSQTQQAILVSGTDYSLSVFDLASVNPIANVHVGGSGYSSVVAVGLNPRLAVQSSQNGPLSVIDLTIQREIGRLPLTSRVSSLAFTSDGRLLLATDSVSGMLNVFDAATFRMLRKVPLTRALGTSAQYGVNAVVTAGRKAFVIASPGSTSHAVAEVDLGTFRVRPIPLPAGNGYLNYNSVPGAALTPDGKYLVFLETIGSTGHIRFIDTSSYKLAFDTTLSNFSSPLGLVITPNGSNPTNIYGYLLHTVNSSAVLTAIDLRPASPTFGQLISGTDVPFPFQNVNSTQGLGLAISSDGTRVVASGQQSGFNAPLPNVFVVDTSAMLAKQGANSIVGTATAAGGAPPAGIAVAPITVTPPASAPTVAQVSSNVTNDADTLIDVYGTNFTQGATVRIGGFGPLPTSLVSSSDLKVTVPQNAPAGAGLDVIVTNPGPRYTPSLQNQSGLLAGGITISPNPLFQPQHQFAALGLDYSIGVYDPLAQSMTRFQSTPPQSNGSILFNFDGAELYSTSYGPLNSQYSAQILQWRVSDRSLQASIPITQTVGNLPLTTSQNPIGGGPVLYVPNTVNYYPIGDVQINMIDVDPASPTFNTILANIPAGFTAQSFYYGGQIAATPDGKFVYVAYVASSYTTGGSQYALEIFDVLNHSVTTVDMKTLGADTYQGPIQVTADGKWLLLHSVYAGYRGVGIVVCDISQPTNPTIVASVNGSLPNTTRPMYFWNFQVVGSLLFAADADSNAVLAFNFDPAHSNFSQLATYFVPGERDAGTIAVTPDGALVYATNGSNGTISVLNANALLNGQPALITKLATSGPISQIAVSPAGPMGPVHNPGQPAVVREDASPSQQRTPAVSQHASPGQRLPSHPRIFD